MEIKYLPIYDRCFSQEEFSDWEKFQSVNPCKECPIDFSIQEKNRCLEVIKKIVCLILKIIIFPWGLYSFTRYVIQRLIMIPLYPAQSRIAKYFSQIPINIKQLDRIREESMKLLNKKGYIVRPVFLQKNNICYNGLLIGHKDTIKNRQWVLQATSNYEPIEHTAETYSQIYKERSGFNTLLINGPGVGRSKGEANPENMGAAFEASISFLEMVVKAKKIAIAGRSLGGSAISEAINQHKFKPGISYLVIRQMTFDKVSNMCSKVVANIFPRVSRIVSRIVKIKSLVKWAGCEIDSVYASKKLSDLGIREVIVQAADKTIDGKAVPNKENFVSDGVIFARASLGYRLIKDKVTNNKVFLCLFYTPHMDDLAIEVATQQINAMT